ncbi:MAG: tRNA (cytidine(34)-2'-O)-methyltransferase [Hyphomicrobiales bacterium]|nr:tRNA (cytidine(34)-2'-O)-methyltransferase [Hyphomicrobiales bacterium]
MIEIALYQPDIPPNTATILRFAACLDLTVHIIEPTGFLWSDKSFRRAGMDYIDSARIVRHASWQAFCDTMSGKRIVLATTGADAAYTDFSFAEGDIVLFGRESAGVPETVHQHADARITIPLKPGLRSLNVAMACAMIAGEAMRQIAAR